MSACIFEYLLQACLTRAILAGFRVPSDSIVCLPRVPPLTIVEFRGVGLKGSEPQGVDCLIQDLRFKAWGLGFFIWTNINPLNPKPVNP